MLPFRFFDPGTRHVSHRPSKAGTPADGVDTPEPQQTHRHLRSHLARFVLLSLLTLIGFYAVASGTGVGAREGRASSHTLPTTAVTQTTAHATPIPVAGTPAGTLVRSQTGAGESTTQPALPADFCLPADVPCLLQQATQWVGQRLLDALGQPIDAINRGSLNFITQTPLAPDPVTHKGGIDAMTPAKELTDWAVGVVDIAVALFVVIGGYHVMLSRHLGMPSDEVQEFLARLALAVLAAHQSWYFTHQFIGLENALCQAVLLLHGLSLLTAVITHLLQGDVIGAGLLVFVLVMILGMMELLLAWQMLVRLALLLLLIILAPLAFLCWALRQTQDWTHLWLSTFAATVFVQFFQVVLLALGGMFVIAVGSQPLSLKGDILSLLASIAVLWLVLRIPSMLRIYALRPVAQAGIDTIRSAQQGLRNAGDAAMRLATLP